MTTRIVIMICGIFLVPLVCFSQSIKGKITNEEGSPIYGVKIHVENTYLVTYTDPDGMYEIKKLPSGAVRIIYTMPGYESLFINQEIKTSSQMELNQVMMYSVQNLKEIAVIQIKADEKTPTTYKNLDLEEINKRNFGQDLPMILRFTPSTVSTSDAGAGIGYTGIRIRGVDPTRTNVTINGIPLNDSESHGVFWVNMPDFSSSAQSIQIQRGVGTSANGAAAFGASINVNTNKTRPVAYGEIDNGFGSFNTWRHTVKAGTGLINKKFSLNARLSKIASEGYIDRASSDLKSFYLDGTWQGKKSSLTANIFSGKERTYQSWYGTPQSVIEGNQEEILAYADRNYIFGDDRDNLLNSGRTYNFYTYENEVDNYQQDHYQLHFSHRFNSKLRFNLKGHYTRGKGYFEQFRNNDDFSDYGLQPLIFSSDTITSGDFIRRRWLDNHFFGGIFSLNYEKGNFDLVTGGGANQYLGGHFGEIIWAEYASNSALGTEYYNNDGNKFEAQGYIKGTYRHKKTTLFADIQYRHIAYQFLGIDEVNGSLEEITQEAEFNFINPKAGLMIDFNSSNNAYISVAMSNREPVRADFRENTPMNRPKHEQLTNLEAGYRYKSRKFMANANFYYMMYQNQLVLTGELNDVGGATRVNVDDSYRMGIELDAGYKLFKNLMLAGNLTLSQNKIAEFTEYVDNYDTGTPDQIVHTNTDLSFSPNLIGALVLNYKPVKGLEVEFTSKFVGQQFLDNTSSQDRKIDAYNFSNLRLSYTLHDVLFKEMTIGIQANNVFNQLYENNGYTWGYVVDDTRTIENFYYPQAGRNFMTRLTIKL
ncbi:MAG: TonB-dependent receptor [Crocinitomicaceae bacterium]|nr:TonB-dependent receptor [Crocinitomicaceae bacterium]